MSLAVRENEHVNVLDNQSEEKQQIFKKPEAVVYSDKDIPNEAGDYEKIVASNEDSTVKESNVENNNEAENGEETNDEGEMENEGKIGCLTIAPKLVFVSKAAHTWSSYLKVKCNHFSTTSIWGLSCRRYRKVPAIGSVLISSKDIFPLYYFRAWLFLRSIIVGGNFAFEKSVRLISLKY